MPANTRRVRKRVVVLGTGFGAFNLVKTLGRDFDITVVSPRNHFLFTPLLPSTTVGTIEFRSIIEPIRHVRNDVQFFHAEATTLNTALRRVGCSAVYSGYQFELEFDILIIAVGAVSNTFNVPGVAEHALFLKELADARTLRNHIIRCFEQANLPGINTEKRQQLLSFVVCGGGPTGVEFAAEMNDFLVEDLSRSYASLIPFTRITLVEATRGILNGFDDSLRRYATRLFQRHRINVLTQSPVVKVVKDAIYLSDGSHLPFGLLLWSTGNGPTRFAMNVDLPKDPTSRIIIDPYFRVKGHTDIYALGDCSVAEGSPLPATSQVAQQQGKYLAKALTARSRGKEPSPFEYRHLGMLAYIGGNRALADLERFKGRGLATWIFWRSAYLSRIVSIKNKVLVIFDWLKAQVFGRDISQF